MPRSPLSAETLLSIELGAICGRNRFTKDPASVIAELQLVAGAYTDLLSQEAGNWSGFYEDEYTRTLALALREIPGAAEWVAQGRQRRDAGRHTTKGFHRETRTIPPLG